MKVESLFDYINTYVSLTANERNILRSKITFRSYLKNQYIVQQGDICRKVSFVLSGCTRVFFIDKKGQEQIISFGIKDWWVADIGSFVTQQAADYNVQCLENTEVIQFSYNTIEELYEEIPKMERFFRKIIERSLVASQKRIVRGFSLTAKERYIYFKENYPEIEKRVPQYMVASYLGITREFLSKIRKEIAKEG
ncbi:Crp/Fnr family transcriptional regulator [Tenacibaculum sp. 190524A02b]